MVALIDADSIVYIVAHKYKDEPEFAKTAVEKTCDDFIRAILIMVQATHYVGAFSSSKNFRHEVYRYQPYKGDRPDKEPHQLLWEPIIKGYLTEKWGFYTSPALEADDVIVALHHLLKADNLEAVICSPDKDLKQSAGVHYNYRTNLLSQITEEEAMMLFWTQVLTGDSTDCIVGIPGLGEVKVRKLFEEVDKVEVVNQVSLHNVVSQQYRKYYGPYYGPEILGQTIQTVMMVSPAHPRWYLYDRGIISLLTSHLFPVPALELEEAEILNILGWGPVTT